MDRRRFVSTTVASLVSGCASLVTVPVTPVDGKITLPLDAYPGLDRAGGFLRVSPQGMTDVLLVMALGNDRFATVSPVCKHRGCSVEVTGELLECPCHGSRYDRVGAVLRGPTNAPLDTYPTSFSSDRVVTILIAS